MDSINTTVYNQSGRFDIIPNRREESGKYWLNPAPAQTESAAPEPAPATGSPVGKHGGLFDSIKIITPEEARKTNNTRIIGLSIAGVTVVTAGGVFALMRGGGNRKLLHFLKTLRSYLEKQLESAKIGERSFDAIDKTYVGCIKVIDTIAKRSEAINNFSTFKDLLFEKIMNITNVTGLIHRKTTELFEHVGRKSVVSHYNKTEDKIFSLQIHSRRARHLLDDASDNPVIIDGVELNKSKWLEKIKEKDIELQNLYEKHFTSPALKKRYSSIKQIADDLKVNLSKLKTFFSSDMYSKFIADFKIDTDRKILQNEVLQQRRQLSYSEPEMIAFSDNSLNNIVKLVSYKDKPNIDLLKAVKHGLKDYLKHPERKNFIKQEITKNLETLKLNVNTKNTVHQLNQDDTKQILQEIQTIENSLTSYAPGKVQEILNIYKHLLPPQEYKSLEKAYLGGIASLDKSIKFETEDFVNKLRDLSLGSAPTDMLSMISGIAIMAYFLGKSDNKEQRTSIALKYGFPAIAGIAVSLYSNAKLYNGTKGLIIASVSSWILNRIGSEADKYINRNKTRQA